LARTLGLLGAMGGAAPGLAWGAARMRNSDPDVGGWKGWLQPYNEIKQAYWGNPEHLIDIHGKAEPDLTGWGVKSIPVDAFNRAVWNDVRQPENPYGTKDPWGDNTQALSTPSSAAAAVSGIVTGAGSLSESHHVSPLQVGIAAAGAAGQGLMAGLTFGRTMGYLAGLKPDTQRKLQDLGFWGGAVTGAVNALFGRR
jgi:hypothetical protein